MGDILVIFLGNSIFKDDRIGLIVGDRLRDRLSNKGVYVKILEEGGYDLIDILSGWNKVVIVDSIKTNKHAVGDVFKIDIKEFNRVKSRSPHYTGLPEAIELLESLGLNPPKEIYIIGIEVYDPYTVDIKLSNELSKHVDKITEDVYNLIINILGISSSGGV